MTREYALSILRNMLILMGSAAALVGWLIGSLWLGTQVDELYGWLAFGVPAFLGWAFLSAVMWEEGIPFIGFPAMPPMPPAPEWRPNDARPR